MEADVTGISGAFGKGFDSVREAQGWCDEFIMTNNPGLIAKREAELSLLVSELDAARGRM